MKKLWSRRGFPRFTSLLATLTGLLLGVVLLPALLAMLSGTAEVHLLTLMITLALLVLAVVLVRHGLRGLRRTRTPRADKLTGPETTNLEAVWPAEDWHCLCCGACAPLDQDGCCTYCGATANYDSPPDDDVPDAHE